jgi:hypothetical protein
LMYSSKRKNPELNKSKGLFPFSLLKGLFLFPFFP